jgi:hypothetical protein
MPLLGLLLKLNCVWCRVELKVVGNLECRIKFYRKKNRGTFSIQLNILILQLTVYGLLECFTLRVGSGPVQAAETAGEPDLSSLRPRQLSSSPKGGGGGGGGRPLQEAGGCLLHAPGEVPHAGEQLAPPPLLEPQGCTHRGRKRPMYLLSSSTEIYSRNRIHERTIWV